jgi:hypothetical protein
MPTKGCTLILKLREVFTIFLSSLYIPSPDMDPSIDAEPDWVKRFPGLADP